MFVKVLGSRYFVGSSIISELFDESTTSTYINTPPTWNNNKPNNKNLHSKNNINTITQT
jgi:hypothetical protein